MKSPVLLGVDRFQVHGRTVLYSMYFSVPCYYGTGMVVLSWTLKNRYFAHLNNVRT